MSVYKILREAIEQEKPVAYTMNEKRYIGSPHALGKGDNVAKVLMYVGTDGHEKEIPAQGQWHAIAVSEIAEVMLLEHEPFHKGHPDAHERSQLREIDIELF